MHEWLALGAVAYEHQLDCVEAGVPAVPLRPGQPNDQEPLTPVLFDERGVATESATATFWVYIEHQSSHEDTSGWTESYLLEDTTLEAALAWGRGAAAEPGTHAVVSLLTRADGSIHLTQPYGDDLHALRLFDLGEVINAPNSPGPIAVAATHDPPDPLNH